MGVAGVAWIATPVARRTRVGEWRNRRQEGATTHTDAREPDRQLSAFPSRRDHHMLWWWAQVVGALRVHPHKHDANFPPQEDRGRSRFCQLAIFAVLFLRVWIPRLPRPSPDVSHALGKCRQVSLVVGAVVGAFAPPLRRCALSGPESVVVSSGPRRWVVGFSIQRIS
jgi:hypothetical protein